MYVLVVSHPNGFVNYYGPFKTIARAEEYGLSVKEVRKNANLRVETLITPARELREMRREKI